MYDIVRMFRVVVYLIALQLEQFFLELAPGMEKILYFLSLSDLFRETTKQNHSLVTT